MPHWPNRVYNSFTTDIHDISALVNNWLARRVGKCGCSGAATLVRRSALELLLGLFDEIGQTLPRRGFGFVDVKIVLEK